VPWYVYSASTWYTGRVGGGSSKGGVPKTGLGSVSGDGAVEDHEPGGELAQRGLAAVLAGRRAGRRVCLCAGLRHRQREETERTEGNADETAGTGSGDWHERVRLLTTTHNDRAPKVTKKAEGTGQVPVVTQCDRWHARIEEREKAP
jgi:hypothetical protein